MSDKLTKKILILEYDEMISDIYKKHFEKNGYLVILANETKVALEKIKKEEPILAFLDLLIADGGGIEILRQLKDWPVKTKFVIFSNNQDTEKSQEAKALGAVEFLIKADYTPEKLLKTVEGYLK